MNAPILALVALVAPAIFAQEIDEEQLFGDAQAVVVAAPPSENLAPSNAEGIKLSGESNANYSLQILRSGGIPLNSFQETSTLWLDARDSVGNKAFAALEGTIASDTTKNSVALRELFLDFNLKQKAYFRLGKQVLQWSRTYFFHPADLVNVEQKSFVERAGALEGALGARLHIPFGTTANLYAFANTQDAQSVQELRWSAKAEALWKGTEIALGGTKLPELDPIWSLDGSTHFLTLDWAGEFALMPQGFRDQFEIIHDTLYSHASRAWTPLAAIGAGRSFDWGNYSDRIRIQGEYFYNGLGYSQAVVESNAPNYPYQKPVQFMDFSLAQGPISTWLLAKGLAQPLTTARHYLAFFSSCNNFLVSDLTLSANGILNIIDKSYLFSSALAYTTLHNLNFSTTLVSQGGPFPGELNFSGVRFSWMSDITYSF